MPVHDSTDELAKLIEDVFEADRPKMTERLITMPLAMWEQALSALREIASQDIVELALDPDWPRRIASEALKKVDPDA